MRISADYRSNFYFEVEVKGFELETFLNVFERCSMISHQSMFLPSFLETEVHSLN